MTAPLQLPDLPPPDVRERLYEQGKEHPTVIFAHSDNQLRAFATEAVRVAVEAERRTLLDVADKARDLLDANQAFLRASTRATLRSETIPPEVTVTAALADNALRTALDAIRSQK